MYLQLQLNEWSSHRAVVGSAGVTGPRLPPSVLLLLLLLLL